ncbi:TetR/AcrR family transcriptional regulator [Microtetraspora sp. NBRC 16547]|uniref:TetR/AcrR family transcriptional regulator n=1 Tax=Microtetraspora sp. NBRC 16547 TaxID=3030993 RepID=UPI0025533CF5|nr:TetR/AcrR family transcriptional regulator [Microtetraspora sp. NBRC 16547]
MARAYSMDRRAVQREQTRSRLIGAVHALIIERRSTAVQMAEIAERAEVSIRTAYNHFASTGELLGAAMATITEEFAQLQPDAVDTSDTPPREAFRRLIRDWYNLFAVDADKLDAMLAIHDSEELGASLIEARNLRIDRITAILDRADEQGLLRVPLRDAVALTYCATGFASWSALVPQFGLDQDHAIDLMMESLLRTLFSDDARG